MATYPFPTPPSTPIEPYITFGLELEFIFAARRQLIEEFLTSPMNNLQIETERFLIHIFEQTAITPSEEGNQPLGRVVRSSEPHAHSYNHWTVTNDASVGASLLEIASAFGKPPAEICAAWHWAGIELVSPVLSAANEAQWIPMLKHIETAVAITEHLGAMRNSACGLHMHFAFLNEDIPLLTLQNLFIIWAICEEEIDRLHPAERLAPHDSYTQSLRVRCGPRYNHLGFARGIYATRSAREIVMLTGAWPRGRVGKRNSKIAISGARHNKPMTVEFREHRGTVDAEEIYWWQRFCHGVLKFCHTMPLTIDTADVIQELKKNVFTLVAGIGDEGVRFFTSKVDEYDLQKQRIAYGLESIYLEEYDDIDDAEEWE